MQNRYQAWNSVDEHCRLFIDLSKKAKNADGTTDAQKREIPWARAIVVPMSYAVLQVYLTQLMGIFTHRDPPLEIQGIGPEDVRSAKLMNAVISWDQTQTNYPLELYTSIQDAMKYGMGGVHDCWEEEWGWKKPEDDAISKIYSFITGKKMERAKEWSKLVSYNKVEAWDPYNFFPDPRVSLSNLQNGEFCGHRLWRGYLEILANSQENGGNYFNVEEIRRSSPRAQAIRGRNRFQLAQMNLIGSTDDRDKGFHAIDSFVVSIIPREWELGDEDRPQKWQFTWVDDKIIIRAHPAAYDHGRFNYSAFESNIDTHVFGNQGSIENIDGLQRFMNWLYNSHLQNVRTHLNNRMLYDPALVETFDVENPNASMHVRVTALGSQLLREGKHTMEGMIHQMQLTDVTGQMLKDVSFMMDLVMRMSGAADQMMGRTTADKRTLGEVTRVGHEGSARMAMHAQMMDIQGLRPLALRWCANRQQFTDTEQYVRIGGNLASEFGGELINGRIKVKPSDLIGNYDYMPKTGSQTPDPAEMASLMFDAVGLMSKNPAIIGMPDRDGKLLDIHEFIKEGLRDKGVRNVDDFYRAMGGMPGQQPPGPQVQVMPDEQVQQQQQQGNIVPIAA